MDTTHQNPEITVEYVSPDLIKPNPKNPRVWQATEREELKKSLERFGCTEALVVNNHPNRAGNIISGHFRYDIMVKELKYKTVPVIFVSLETEALESELLLRMNQNGGSFSWDLLKDFDMNLLLESGFGELELGVHWDALLGTEQDTFSPEKALAEHNEVYVKTGDLWQLGSHRILCADSTEPENITRLMDGNTAQMINFDPVYGINFDYNSGLTTKGKYGGTTTIDSWKNLGEYKAFLKACFESALPHCDKDLHVYTWNDQNHIGIVQELYRELGLKPQRVLYWLKDNFNMVPGVAYNKAVEPCIYGTKGKPFLAKGIENLHEFLNRDIATGTRAFDDIADYFELWLVKRKAGQDYLHPTEKPVTLYERPLRRCSRPNDIILDMASGSGTVIVACEQMKRRAYMCEIEPRFCQVTIERYEALTGEKAVLVSGGSHD